MNYTNWLPLVSQPFPQGFLNSPEPCHQHQSLMEQWSRKNIPPNKHWDQKHYACCLVPAAKAQLLLSKPVFSLTSFFLHRIAKYELQKQCHSHFHESAESALRKMQLWPQKASFWKPQRYLKPAVVIMMVVSTFQNTERSSNQRHLSTPVGLISKDLTNLNNFLILWAL